MPGLVLPPKVTFLAFGGIDFHLLYEVNIIYLRSTDSPTRTLQKMPRRLSARTRRETVLAAHRDSECIGNSPNRGAACINTFRLKAVYPNHRFAAPPGGGTDNASKAYLPLVSTPMPGMPSSTKAPPCFCAMEESPTATTPPPGAGTTEPRVRLKLVVEFVGFRGWRLSDTK